MKGGEIHLFFNRLCCTYYLNLDLNLIEKSVLNLDGLIKEILDFSRNDRTEIKAELIDFEKLIGECYDDLKYLETNNPIKRIVSVKGVGPSYSDIKRLKILFNNLISNALRYHNSKQESAYIRIEVEQDRHKAILKVIDNGTGISSEIIGNIFKMFYRGSGNSKGSGLGLYIAKEVVEKLNGILTVESELGKGSTFTVKLQSLNP